MTNSLLKYFAPSDQPLVKAIGASADGLSTILYVLPTPLGSPQKKDLHEEFFMPETYFGDDHIKTRYGLYEHLMNDYSNPVMAEMGVQKQILGAATLLTEDQKKAAGLTVAERWYALEVKRSLEYHDMLMNMVDAKAMGASTQCFMNGKRKNADGGITMWLENEISLTPTPANPSTIGVIANAVKGYNIVKSATPLLPKLMLVKNGQLVEVNLESPETSLETPAPEVVAEIPLDTQIEAILSGTEPEAVVDEPITIGAKALQTLIATEIEKAFAPIKMSMQIFLDVWASNPESAAESRDALLTLLGIMTEADTEMKAISKSTKETAAALLAVAKHMKTAKVEEIKHTATPREQTVIATVPKAKSGVPEHLRLEAK